jgi:D-tyrosyl-tRNA(Tyr) deacylase
MRAVVQRVRAACVEVAGQTVAHIDRGLLVLLGVAATDTSEDAAWLAGKVGRLRIFDDDQGKMNLDVRTVGGEILVVSQFTLLADCRKGNRPSYTDAAAPNTACRLYEEFVQHLVREGYPVQTGVFREHMLVHLVNDGPVTIVLDSSARR